MRIKFPYGHDFLEHDFDDNRLVGILDSKLSSYKAEKSETELVREAIENPIGSEKLSDLARGKKNIVIIASDHTRPVPSKIIMPLMLSEIRKGNPDADITILIATGCHRGTTRDELRGKFGDEIFNNEKILVHDCDDTENLVSIATLPSGGELVINKIAYEADLLVAEGFIEPHFFAGFSGSRKSVLPGVCSRKTVMYNHNAMFIDSPYARTGILENNPIHKDMVFAARKAGLAFIVNTVLDPEKHVVYAVAGDVEEAHIKGCEFLKSQCMVPADKKADIVVTTNGGYPLDQNIYQAVKGMTAAESVVNDNGVIIMIAKSNDGDGGKVFYETFKNASDIGKLMQSFLATPAEETIVDQWQSQIFARVLLKARVIYISDAEDEVVKDLHMIPAHSIGEALAIADSLLAGVKGEGTILAIPDGVSVIPV
ncbi:MAG: nickel-dependent lactate racemase [Eubacteriales bacterium]|nr:nickel-dependent lactate racemase [Eubacteriales bacterium]